MRGGDSRSGELFSYVDLEARVRRDHPLRVIREIANAALGALAAVEAAVKERLQQPQREQVCMAPPATNYKGLHV